MRVVVAAAWFLTAFAAAEVQAQTDLYTSGVEARLANRFGEAYQALSKAAEEDPGNSDVLVQLGLTLIDLQRFDEATTVLNRVLEIAPDYLDADIALARIAYFRGENAAALTRIDRVLAAAPENGDALTLRDQIENAAVAQVHAERASPAPAMAKTPRLSETRPVDYKHRVDFDVAFSDLGKDDPDWWEVNTRYSYHFGKGATVSVLSQDAYRYEKFDVYSELRFDVAPTNRAYGYFFGGFTPDADFLPNWSIGAGGGITVAKGDGYFSTTVATIESKISDYQADRIYILNPGVEQYFGDGSNWATLRLLTALNAQGNGGVGFSARLDRFFTDTLRGFLGYVSAPESSDGAIQQTKAIFGGVVVDFTEALTFRGTVAYESDPNRTTISIGTARRF